MGGEWRSSSWGNEISLEYGKALRGYDVAHGKYRVFGSNGPVGWTTQPLVAGPGVILGRKGAYRGVQYWPDPFFVIDTAYYVVPKTELDMRWLYYAIKHYKLGEIDDGSPIPSTTRAAVYVQEVDVPPITEQLAIAHILGTLDDKIELNRKMNETLEAIARAIFKSWFVNAIENGIPKGWRIGTLGDVCTVQGGFAYKSEDFAFVGYPVIKIKNITNNKDVDVDDVDYLPAAFAQQTKDFWLNDGDLIMAMTGATVGKFGLMVNPEELTCVMNQRVCRFFSNSKQGENPWFLFCALSQSEIIEQIIGTADGSAQPNISTKGICSTTLIVPPDELIFRFNQLVDSVFLSILRNKKESRILATLRDTLLPKLMSGEMKVEETKCHE